MSQGPGHGGHSGGGRGGHRGRGHGNGGGRGQGQRSEQGSNFYQALDDDDDYQCNKSTEVEDNPNEQYVPCSYCVESHVHNHDNRSLPNNQTLLILVVGSFSSLHHPFLPFTVPPSSMCSLVAASFSFVVASG